MAKVIDVRGSGGELVVLGKAIVLPASISDGTDLPLDGSIRFNPESDSVEIYSSGSWAPLGGSGSGSHTHLMSQITGLNDALATKASTIHAHTFNDISGLQAALDLKSNTNHNHAISSVVNLQSTLDNLQATVASKANTGHIHVITNVTGLTEALDGKAAVSHFHSTLEITGLQAKLDTNKMQQYSFCISGKPAASMRYTVAIAQRMDIAKDFLGSVCHTTSWPSSDCTIQVRRNNGLVGTIVVNTSGVATFSSSNVIVLLAGDWIDFEFPASQDATFGTIGITLLGERK